MVSLSFGRHGVANVATDCGSHGMIFYSEGKDMQINLSVNEEPNIGLTAMSDTVPNYTQVRNFSMLCVAK